jgi:hypothetical protein
MKKITLDELQEYTVISVSDERQIQHLTGADKDDNIVSKMVDYLLAVSEDDEGCCCGCC